VDDSRLGFLLRKAGQASVCAAFLWPSIG